MAKSIKDSGTSLIFLMKLIDSAIIVGTGIACFFILEPIKNFLPYTGFMPENYLTIIVLGFMFSAWWFPAFHVYQSWRWSSFLTEIRGLLLGWTFSIIGLLAFIFFTKTATEFSRHWFILWFVSVFSILMLQRFILRWVLRTLRQKGVNLRHIVIVGDGLLSEQLIEKIQQATWMGLNIKGIFADMPIDNITNLPHLGKTQDVLAYVEENAIDQVWITLPLKAMEKIENLCRELHSVVVEVKLVPDISSLRLLNYSTIQLDGIAVINMSVSPMSSGHRLLKWLEDKILSFVILLCISPLLGIIALAVKLSSPGPVFYKQERVGNNGKKFQMLKFRSMPVDADKELVWGGSQEKKKTRIGLFLRQTSLDELPQFINVLKGDMSIVGPRPERTVFVEQFKHEINSYMQKHLVQAGITGWAQVNGWRGDTSLKTRLEYDLFYIENWSFWFDLKIIFMTLYKGVNGNEKA
ncbi:MAG: undecaprenyl-phosphate glucose phosphotransferase [Methyloprofundus sp.]|nr:undecaprenyl-phosphate glucose phosphotransferase [Methyloprofundus sp.]